MSKAIKTIIEVSKSVSLPEDLHMDEFIEFFFSDFDDYVRED